MSIKPCPAPKCRGVDDNAVLTERPMCDHHTGQVSAALRELPRRYDDLAAALLPSQRASADDIKVKTSKLSAPLPINEDARAAQEDMRTLLLDIESSFRIATRRGFPPIAMTERGVICQLEGWARRNLDAILAVDVELGVEVLKLRHRIRATLGETRLTHRPNLPCPDCNEIGYLTREDGSDVVACRNCGGGFDFEDERLVAS